MPKSEYRILIVDDDKSYAQIWIERAFDDHLIDLIHYIDWESAQTQLKANPDKFQAIILDAKGKLTTDDASESMKHVIKALQDLKELEGHGLFFPYVINTGFIDDSVIGLLEEVKIFSKGNEDALFKYLIDKIKCSPYDKLRRNNNLIFSLFDEGYLPPQSGRKLLDVLIFAEHPAWNKATDDFFNPVRKILEGILLKLKELGKIDKRCFPEERINLKDCIEYIAGYRAGRDRFQLSGNKIIPTHIYNSLNHIYNMTGTFSHDYLEKTEVSHYALQSVVYALCEVLYWFRDFINLEANKTNINK